MNTVRPQSCKIVKISAVKPEIRVLGIDDGVFKLHSKELVDVIGVVYRGGYWLDGFMHTRIHVDGLDATEKLVEMIINSPHYKQLRVIMLSGVTLAGFNVVDIEELYEKIRLPIIAVTRDKPNFERVKKALQNLPESEKRWEKIKKAGKIFEVKTRNDREPIYVHVSGISQENAKSILKTTSTRSSIPEALRVAHIIASGLTKSRKDI